MFASGAPPRACHLQQLPLDEAAAPHALSWGRCLECRAVGRREGYSSSKAPGMQGPCGRFGLAAPRLAWAASGVSHWLSARDGQDSWLRDFQCRKQDGPRQAGMSWLP